jgi:hypothetical protein
MPGSDAASTKRYRVYVVRLSGRLASSGRFMQRNPGYRPGKPLVYVGSTGRTPEDRFEAHLHGPRRYNRYVRMYGRRLFPWAYRDLPTFATREAAEAAERRRAEELRARGWAVWQG